MKTSTTAIAALFVAILAFLVGRSSSAGARDPGASPPPTRFTKASIRSGVRAAGPDHPSGADRSGNPVTERGLTPEQARLLTSEERLDLIRQGALTWNNGNQTALLCGLIGGLDRDEIGIATQTLGAVQDAGNFQSQEVWDSLWTQWGRVDPAKGMEFFAEDNTGKSRADARHLMEGWLETDPVAAFAWAKLPKRSGLEAAAAALAITSNANGDPERMEASILALPADDITRTACLQDYFDLAGMTGNDGGAAAIYDQLSPALRTAGWSVALQRISYEDPEAAARWLEGHADDPGRDYAAARRFVVDRASVDPAATTKWAAGLPGLHDSASGQPHPAYVAISVWLDRDAAAARTWLKSQAAANPWAGRFLESQ